MYINIDDNFKFDDINFGDIRASLENLDKKILIRLLWIISDILDEPKND